MFDAAYYQRYYENPRTRVASRQDVRRLAAFVCAYLRHLRVSVRRVVDLGCGLGWWRDSVLDSFPNAHYVGVEVSEYLCEKHGWRLGSVTEFEDLRGFDLVVCQGVLQYLPDRDARAAIDNLATLCRGALFLEALTTEDWERNCDKSRTDGAVHLRSADWYRRRLRRHFTNCGGGVWLPHDSTAVLYELERGA